jgi:hypothetical protein
LTVGDLSASWAARVALLVTVASVACGRAHAPTADSAGPTTPQSGGPSTPSPLFVDVAAAAGLVFTHVNGMSGQLYMAEVLAPGVALFDYDGDGDLDVYLVQGQALGPGVVGPAAPLSGDRLFRNELSRAREPDARDALRFTDVTAESKIAARGYGMGVATGDIDNDGDLDLYLTKFNAPNELWRNNGDGTFSDWSRKSGTNHQSWSTSASFVDVNRDGWLDLYVANYIRYSLDVPAPCASPTGARDYCTPDSFPPLPDRLFVNRGDGTFADSSAASGIAGEFGPALGVSTADFDGDGWTDIYVANDGKENQLWTNRGGTRFENTALLSGVALPATAKAEASMGVDAGDLDDDGDEDLFVTELTGEGSNLFVNDGTGTFEDRSTAAGLGASTLPFTGFGTAWLDVENDGRLDLLTVNGTVQVIERLRQAKDPLPLHQRKLLFRNLGGGRFVDISHEAGAAFQLSEVGRGVATGDVDNDGDIDVLIGNNNGPVRLLLNQAAPAQWVGLRLVGVGGRDMPGARVEVAAAGEPTRYRRARADGSYASANDPRVVVGLGASTAPRTVTVRWPGGRQETWTGVAVNRYTTLVEGAGP